MEVFTTGFPRSGSTWLNRILCDLLDAPLQNVPDTEKVWMFSENRDNKYIVRKTHWYQHQWEPMNGAGYDKQPAKIIGIYRDPRDMVISMMFYRHGLDPIPVMHSIQAPAHPTAGFKKYVSEWLAKPPDVWFRYEDMHAIPEIIIGQMYTEITGEQITEEKVASVIRRQSFEKWSESFPHSMRKGVVGDWQNHFTREAAELMDELYGEELLALGYENNNNWINETLP